MYLYTGVIEFAPFGSKENRRSRSTDIANSTEDEVPRPSPKSIYRLADKVRINSLFQCSIHTFSDNPSLQYGVSALKTLALNRICGELGKCDIIEESFSKFASE